jgi:hypothetical protein
MGDIGIIMLVISAISVVFLVGGLWADNYDRRDARRRTKDGPRWR